MKRKFALTFKREGGYAVPEDKKLHQLVVKWCDKNLDTPLNLEVFELVRVVCEVDEAGDPIEVTALGCGGMRFDLSVARYQDPASGEILFDSIESFLHDIGKRGQEVFVFLSEGGKPENMCPMREEMLKKYRAEPSQRYSVIVK